MDPSGSRCPLEIGLIMKRVDEYQKEFHVADNDVVDMSLIKDLVDYDVQLFRAENRIAMQGDFIEDVVVSVTDNGQEITAPQISKAAEYKEKIMTKKHKVLQLMHSTRSDKAGDRLTLTLNYKFLCISVNVSNCIHYGAWTDIRCRVRRGWGIVFSLGKKLLELY